MTDGGHLPDSTPRSGSRLTIQKIMGLTAVFGVCLFLMKVSYQTGFLVTLTLLTALVLWSSPPILGLCASWLSLVFTIGHVGFTVCFWLAAWQRLGHMPVASVDDPYGISPGFGLGSRVFVIGLVPYILSGPLGLAALIVGLIRGKGRPFRLRFYGKLALAACVAWGLSYLFYQTAGGRIIDWILD